MQATSRELSESAGSLSCLLIFLLREGKRRVGEGVGGQKQRHSLGRPSGNSSGLNAGLELSERCFLLKARGAIAFRGKKKRVW